LRGGYSSSAGVRATPYAYSAMRMRATERGAERTANQPAGSRKGSARKVRRAALRAVCAQQRAMKWRGSVPCCERRVRGAAYAAHSVQRNRPARARRGGMDRACGIQRVVPVQRRGSVVVRPAR